MASPNLTELVTTTLRNRRRKLADNVLNHNSLLRKLNQSGNVQNAAGGRTLVEELEYAENSTFKYYDGYEVLDISPSDVFSAAEYNWKQAAVVVSISGKERRQNSGREQMIRLLDRRIRNSEKTMMNNLSIGVYSDGTGTTGKQIGGLQLLVPDDPTTGTVGGINRATFTFWQSVKYGGVADGGGAVSATNIQNYMNSVWIQLVRGADRPNMIVADSTYFNFFWQSLQAIQRIGQANTGDSGFENLMYHGPGGRAEVMYDDQCPAAHMYFLNSDYFFWRPHSDANMEPLSRREPVNQDAVVVPLIFMGNLTMSNSSLQGVLIA
jgi:hypothetical protein